VYFLIKVIFAHHALDNPQAPGPSQPPILFPINSSFPHSLIWQSLILSPGCAGGSGALAAMPAWVVGQAMANALEHAREMCGAVIVAAWAG
jgi:hypothetical protein